MSLFNLLQWQLIEKPKQTYNYLMVRKQKEELVGDREKEEKAEWKALCKEMKEKMTKEEFSKRRAKAWYDRNKEKRINKQLWWYHMKKEEEAAMLEEIYEEVYDPLPEPINYDKYYTEKFREDDMTKDGKYRFCWRSSKIIFEDWKFMLKWTEPIRVYWRRGMNASMNRLANEEAKAYQYLQPHLAELMDSKFFIKRYQTITKYPLRTVSWKLAKLTEASDIAPSHICNILSAIQRGKYIASEVYLWRTSFIVGDVIVTQTGHMFQICLENNLPWLTPQNVEQIHDTRIKWRKKKWKEKPPIYMVKDAYLVKYQLNERETQFYIIPR